MQPRLSSRIKSLETRATTIEAAVEELSSDQAEGLKDLKQDNKALFDHVQAGFDQAHSFVQEQFDEIRGDIAELKAAMATKDDIADIKATQEKILTFLQQKLGE